MGNQQRSAITSMLAIDEIRNGIIGDVYKGEAYYSNNRGSIGIGKIVPVPKFRLGSLARTCTKGAI